MSSRFIPIESSLKKAGFSLIAGLDEAGRGPLAGPVVSAAVILPAKVQLPGLNDSKLLSEKQRQRLFRLITAKSLCWAISYVPPEVIDQINILNAVRLANQNCLDALDKKADYALFDGRDKQLTNLPHQCIIKGDQKVRSIAAASVLAKVARDHLMQAYAKEYPLYAFQKHKGYGTRLHRQLISQNGPCVIHRRSFRLLEVDSSQPTLP